MPRVLNLRSTADDVKVAYKKALRAVHPDKLVGASMSDRMKAEQMFKALRDAYALDMQVASEIERKEKESTNRANAYYRLSKKFGLNGVSGSNCHCRFISKYHSLGLPKRNLSSDIRRIKGFERRTHRRNILLSYLECFHAIDCKSIKCF